MLTDGQYEYHQNSKGKNLYWLCTNREVCKARITTNNDLNNLIVLKSTSHTHFGDPSIPKVRLITEKIKESAKDNPNAKPSCIIREELREISDTE